jgi:hypothetical protein
MSLEQTAYIARPSLPDHAALQAAIDALGFDCKVDASYEPFKSRGFLPCVLGGQNSGFEIYFESAATNLAYFPQLIPMVASRDVAITFRWGGDMAECACVLIVSAALAKSCGAIVHYHDDDIVNSGDELVNEAQAALQAL